MDQKQILEKIRDDAMLSKRFKEEFKAMVEPEGEIIFEPLTPKDLLNTIINQGFWSGTKYRIYWSLSAGFIFEEKRYV